MSRYNLLSEPWISVILLESGKQKEVSLLEFFREAHQYRCLAGDTKTQDFAVLRLLLAVVHTVFSRVDADGKTYPYLDLDARLVPTDQEGADEDDQADTWKDLWQAGRFPEVVCDYLELWRDRFFLQDEKYPFFQVTKEEMERRLPEGKRPTVFYGKNFNRAVSESNNKVALFSPRIDGGEGNKDRMTVPQLIRWLITLQGYVGLADKATLASKEQKPSKGWLYDIGGLYLSGQNMFETLIMNYLPPGEDDIIDDLYPIQRPCWEYSGQAMLDKLIEGKVINNLSELYTNWSRAISLDPEMDLTKPIQVGIAKLPGLVHVDFFLEPMTLWQKNQSGVYKGHFTPRKYRPGQAMWRSFGSFAMKSSEETRRPGIMDQYDRIVKIAGNRWITLEAVGMQDDGNATSWVPVDELTDSLRMNDLVITDDGDEGWIIRIHDVIEETQAIIDKNFRRFLMDIAEIRGLNNRGFVERGVSGLYYQIDKPFRQWIETLGPDDSKSERILGWKKELETLVLAAADQIIEQAAARDLVVIDGKNIVTAYLTLKVSLTKKLGV